MLGSDAATSREDEACVGSGVLSVFENPLNPHLLRAHLDGPQRLADLQAHVGSGAQTTVRAAVTSLSELGALSSSIVQHSPHAVTTELTAAGIDMLSVDDRVEAWLGLCPDGPISPDSGPARAAIKALVGGWSSRLMRVLADGPRTLTEMDTLISAVSFSSLERRIAWMRATREIEAVEAAGRGTPFVLTDWLRRAVGPVCAAIRCEQRYLEGAAITEVEVEAWFLLAIPLAQLPPDVSGTCVLAVQVDAPDHTEERPRLAGVTVEVERGEVASCLPLLGPEPATWVIGGHEAWLDAIVDGRIEDLRIGGDRPELALALAAGLHGALA